MTTIKITTAFLTLGQFLKEAGLIDSGGAAKWYLGEHPVTVNGAAEDRRGRKLYPHDQIKVADQTYVIGSA